ncbi:MAG: hypothetical protein KatS3mg012_0549 [Gaiellaceae bacterium]|nr:MAG: hypothetical protein KatS3mg012_0549 [Gaiellaceae bacterium]
MYALSALFVVAALAGVLFLDYEPGRAAAWVAVLVGGATLMLVGQRVERSPALSATLVSTGAIAGGFPLFWTIVVPVAAAAVVASSVALARRQSARA